MDMLLQAVWGGIVFGSVYGLMAVGLTLIWGALNFLNMAHGALYLCGGYLAWTLMDIGLPLLPAFALAVAGTAVVGIAMYTAAVRPILGKPGWLNATMISTIAAGIVMENAALLIWGPRNKVMPELFKGDVVISNVVVTYHSVAVVVISGLLLVALQAFLRKSRHGLAVRAVSQQMEAAQLMAVPVRRVFLIIMAVSAALAGVAGVLLTPVLVLNPAAGFLPLLKALIVVILGGLGSVKGTIWAALAVGFLESFVQVYVGASWSLPILFLMIVVVLTARPQGFFGQPAVQRL
jgi:branched-chain amino acid transport system permease protein